MCLTIPGKIKSIKGDLAIVDNGNRREEIDLSLVQNAKVGDWVLYATKMAIHKISKDEAAEIISLLEEKYPKIDTEKLPERFKRIIVDLKTGREVSKADLVYLMDATDNDVLETLYAEANTLRKSLLEDFVCIHGILEFSNHCKNNCHYCGIRRDSKTKRYRMKNEEIIDAVGKAVTEEGYKLIVLQSGEDQFYSDDDLIKIITEIKRKYRVFIFLSLGERSPEFYRNAKTAGASGSLFRFETSNERLYQKLHPGHTYEERLGSLKMQLAEKYYLASGGLIGLPEQTSEDLVNDLLLIKELGIPMLSAGPYLEAEGTPSANEKGYGKTDKLRLTLNYLAVARLIMPELKIPVTTALETLDNENGRHKGLLAGANALMFNITPEKYREDYKIYDHKYLEREKVWQKYGLFKGEESWEMIEEKLQIN